MRPAAPWAFSSGATAIGPAYPDDPFAEAHDAVVVEVSGRIEAAFGPFVAMLNGALGGQPGPVAAAMGLFTDDVYAALGRVVGEAITDDHLHACYRRHGRGAFLVVPGLLRYLPTEGIGRWLGSLAPGELAALAEADPMVAHTGCLVQHRCPATEVVALVGVSSAATRAVFVVDGEFCDDEDEELWPGGCAGRAARPPRATPPAARTRRSAPMTSHAGARSAAATITAVAAPGRSRTRRSSSTGTRAGGPVRALPGALGRAGYRHGHHTGLR